MQIHIITTFVRCILEKSLLFRLNKKMIRNQQNALAAVFQDQTWDLPQTWNFSSLDVTL